jgi:hypothetical protein
MVERNMANNGTRVSTKTNQVMKHEEFFFNLLIAAGII